MTFDQAATGASQRGQTQFSRETAMIGRHLPAAAKIELELWTASEFQVLIDILASQPIYH